MVGKTLGHYEILEPLGKGGMGEVYRARDRTLDRDVAIKVLPDDLAADADRLARFEREAKLLAALSHSNIGAIHGLDESGGVRFLVLELIEGETLEQRLTKGAIPVPEALDIARQIAEALEAAHDAGIIHRDVKPANVLLTPKGGVKVLDFGIAKSTVLDANVAETELATSLTIDGTLMGTPPYMAPEQIRGKEADTRVDIWAFGCVVYEMLTGNRAFPRETMADTLVAILETEPDWEALPLETPVGVLALLQRCLRKRADRRMRDIGDARIEVEDSLSIAPSARGELTLLDRTAVATDVRSQRATSRRFVPWMVSTVAVAVAAVALGWAVLRPGLDLPPRITEIVVDGAVGALSLSPDGSKVGFWGRAETRDAPSPVWVQDHETGTSRIVYETEGMRSGWEPYVQWSPDGESALVEYSVVSGSANPRGEHRVVVVPLAGGPPRVVWERETLGATTWHDDSSLLLVTEEGIQVLEMPGGQPRTLIESLPANGSGERPRLTNPRVLPDGSILYLSTSDAGGRLMHFDGDDSALAWNLPAGLERSFRYFYSEGYLLFLVDRVLMALPFDRSDRAVLGTPLRVVEDVGSVTVAGDGSMIYFKIPPPNTSDDDVVLVDRAGEIIRTFARIPGQIVGGATLSPDGQRVAFAVGDRNRGSQEAWVYGVDDSSAPLLLPGTAQPTILGWLPGGEGLVVARQEDSGSSVWVEDAAGSAEPLQIVDSFSHVVLSADGRHLAYTERDSGGEGPATFLTLEADGRIVSSEPVVAETEVLEMALAPNARWMATPRLGRGSAERAIWLTAFPDGGSARRLAPGRYPRWSRDGRELFFVTPAESDGGRRLMSVSIDPESGVPAGDPRELFSLDAPRDGAELMATPLAGFFYDVSPDGQGFVMVLRTEDVRGLAELRMMHIQNWTRALLQAEQGGR